MIRRITTVLVAIAIGTLTAAAPAAAATPHIHTNGILHCC
jgi:hypothetical protein